MTSPLWMRSKLFVPGSRPELFAKALASAVDAISFDLEDAVPEAAKGSARQAVGDCLKQAAAIAKRKQLIIRINAIDSRHFEADLLAAAAVTPATALPALPQPLASARAALLAGSLLIAGTANGQPLLMQIEPAIVQPRWTTHSRWPGGARDMRSGGVTGIHPAREGHLYVSVNTPRFWKALCQKTGLHDLLADARLDSVRRRALHSGEIVPRLHRALAAHTALEWEDLFGDEVPCAAARKVEDLFDHPQVLAEQMIGTIEHRAIGPYRGVTRPITFGRTPGPAPFASPTLGQDSVAVAVAAGVAADEVLALRAAGVLR